MTKLPSLTGQQVIKILSRAGFQVQRQRSSHVYLKHPNGRATVVPIHRGESIGSGLLNKILRDTEIDREDFIKLF